MGTVLHFHLYRETVRNNKYLYGYVYLKYVESARQIKWPNKQFSGHQQRERSITDTCTLMYGIPVVSSEQDNKSVLSGLKATRYTGPLCPWRILFVSAERSSIMRTNTSSTKQSHCACPYNPTDGCRLAQVVCCATLCVSGFLCVRFVPLLYHSSHLRHKHINQKEETLLIL